MLESRKDIQTTTEKIIKGVIFLGNPGKQYQHTRHNMGWLVCGVLPFLDHATWQKKFKGVYTQIAVTGIQRLFLKPETYMNLSGESVREMNHFFKLMPHEILVVHDDIELEFGCIDFKKGGGLAGHNGLRSIVSNLGTQDFYRFRLGISRPDNGDVSSYVLHQFSEDEQLELHGYLTKAADALLYCLQEGIGPAMDTYSKKSVV